MIIEIISILIAFTGGFVIVRSTGFNGWALPALGYVVGLCIQVSIGSLLAIFGLPTHPVIILSLTLLFPLAGFLFCLKRDVDVSLSPKFIILSFVAIIIMVIFLREANLVNWHTDTFRYLMTGTLLAEGNYSYVNLNLVTKRLLSVAVIHAPANLQGEYYLRSAFPFLSISTVMIFAWFIKEGFREKISGKHIHYIIIFGILLLVTNNRFVFNAFYINGHLLFATLVLVIAGCSWLIVRRAEVPTRALLTMQTLAIPALVVTRPEGSIAAGLALLPILVLGQILWFQRAMLLGALGLSTTIWHSFVVYKYIQAGSSVPFSASGLLGLGIVALLATPILSWRYIGRFSKHVLIFVELGLWLALLVFAIRQPEIFFPSVNATIENVVFNAGSWGLSLVVLAVLVVLVLIFTDVPDRVFLRFPVTTFVPLSFLLAFLRGSAYRVGNGDSLNRSLIHIVPLAILFIVSTAESERWMMPSLLSKLISRISNVARTK